MTYKVNVGKGKIEYWSHHELEEKLVSLKYANKKVEWIRSDLSTKKSNCLTRLIWTVVAKHFHWMRKTFYKVDLDNSRYILNQLRPQIESNKDKALAELFNDAVNNFNTIAPFHWTNTVYIPSSWTTDNTYSKPSYSINSTNKSTDSVSNPLISSWKTAFKPSSSSSSSLPGISITSKEDFAPYNHAKLYYGDAKTIVESAANKPGTFLIRESWDSDYKVVTVLNNSKAGEHIRFKVNGNKFENQDGKKFDSLNELVAERGCHLLYPVLTGAKNAITPTSSSGSISHSFSNKSSGLFDKDSPVEPKTTTVKPPVKKVETEYAEALESGTDVNELLKKAYDEKRPAIAAWLVQKGGSLEELNKYATLKTVVNDLKERMELLEWLKTVSTSVPATPENLDHFALELGYGYKSANLLVMENKAEEMSKELKTAMVKVPPFLPVGDFEMSQYLRTHIPEVYKMWNEFKEKSFDPAQRKAFLEAASDEKASKAGLKITPEGEKVLEQISTAIMNHFRDKPYHSLQMRDWLKKEKPQFLIIRSTGKEDSDTNSNAGGNASIPYVKPDEQAISEAIGEVIASYFGEKSINQRILCGDRTLFTDEKPFVPILMQEMVGENVAGHGSKDEDIPRCGVLFTCQNDKAEGVTFIQTGLGNNEGVVSSQVGVDSYYVDKNNKIHAVVREKATRFVSMQTPSGKMTVAPIKNNNKPLELSQALPPKVILDIKRVADNISESYAKEKGTAKPMDMEYTVKLKEKGYEKPVIYLLQARPLMNTEGEDKIEHTYLDLKGLKDVPQENKINGEVILDGNAYVRQITDPQSVIFADDLPKGEYDYSHSDDPASKKVIFIKKSAAATSHPAVILRPKGVAVIVVDNPEEFATLKKMAHFASKDKPLLVDTQRGIMVACEDKNAPNKIIKKGLVSYPIPLEVTVPPSRFSNIDMKEVAKNKGLQHLLKGLLIGFNNEADTLIEDLRGGKDFLPIAKKGVKDGYEVQELLDIMATKDTEEAKLALATLLKLMKNRLVLSMHETEDFRAGINKPMFQVFDAALRLAKNEIVPALENHDPQSLERLYPIKFLDAMIYQKHNSNVMGGYSYSQVLALDISQQKAMKEAEKKGIKFDGPNGQSLIYLHQLNSKSYSENCNKNWLTFVEELAKLDTVKAQQYISRVLPIIQQVNDINITDIWMNTEFNEIWKANSSKTGTKRLDAVILALEQASKKNKDTFGWIKERLGTLDIQEQGIPLWAEPSHAKKNAPKLRKTFTENLGFDKSGSSANSLKKVYDKSDALGKLALLQYIRSAVNTYDCTVKAVKGTDKFSSDQAKAVQVAEMLEGYMEMMEATFSMVSVTDQNTMQNLNMGSTVLFNEYVNRLKNGYTYKFGFGYANNTSIGFNNLVSQLKSNMLDPAKMLEARDKFAVDALVVGSKADLNFSVHWPDTLEEYFTTFHQNMEQVVKFLNTKHGLDTNLLSESAQDICKRSKDRFKQDISYLILEEGKLRVGYQIPLRQHSANFVISYDPQDTKKGIDIKVQMFGNDENKRWDWGAAYGAVLAYHLGSGFVENTPPKINYNKPEGVEFTVKIPSDFKQIDKLVDAIHFATKWMTMDKNGDPSTFLNYLENGYPSTFSGLGPIDWNTISPECFKYTLHMNRTLIGQLLAKNQNEAAAKVAIQSLRGLAYYGIQDYDRDGGSLRTTALQTLKKLIPTQYALHEEVKNLVEDADMLKNQSKVCSELKVELAKVMKPEEAFEQFMVSGDWLEAYLIAKNSKKAPLQKKFEIFIGDKLKHKDTDLLLNLVIGLNGRGMEKDAEELILKKGLEAMLSVEQVQKLQMLKQKELRKEYLTNLNSNVSKLQSQVSNFEGNHATIMKLCADSLIGLSQCSDYNGKSFGGFSQLNKYLGSSEYSYVYDNQYGDTSKLRKAGPLYMIRGFESSNPEVRNSAVEAFKKLALDYVLFAKNEPQVGDINHVMHALARGYMDAASRKKTAARELLEIFQGDKTVIKEIAQSPKMPGTLKTQLYDVVKA